MGTITGTITNIFRAFQQASRTRVMPKQHRVTIKHVAKEAGVSTQTVSRVINERHDVAAETRKRVLQIIQDMGYQPSELARSLIQSRSYMLGVVTAGLKHIGGPGRALNGITTAAEELGYAIILKELPSFKAENPRPLIQSLLARQVDGILWAVPEIGENHAWVEQELDSIRAPVVFLSTQPRAGIPSVSFDNYLGGRLATQHLIKGGRRHIGHVSGPIDWWEARERKRGWEDALRAANLQAAVSMTVEGNWSSASGEAAFSQLLDSFPELEAVFVANDQMALSVLQVCQRRGRRVPQEIAVVGFDDLAESAYFWPPLTTIRQDQTEAGSRAVHELVNRVEALNDGIIPPDPLSVIIPPQLMIRDSSR
jgi:LacI family transcriptional regulator